MGPKSKKIYYYIVGTIFSIIAIAIICQFIMAFYETETPVFETKQEYLDLFKDEVKNQLKPGASYNSKNRNSIATLDYNKGKYSLAIYKIPTVAHFTLNNISIADKGKIFTGGAVYTVVNNGYLDLNYIIGGQEVANKIKVSYTGKDSQIIVKNDSVFYWYLNYKSISFRYNENDVIDMYANLENQPFTVPVSVLFLKRNNQVYLILMSINDQRKSLDPQLLYSMIK